MMTTDQDEPTALHAGFSLPPASNAGLDRVARLAARTFAVPMAAVGVCGEACLWFVARTGALPPMVPGGRWGLRR